MTLLCLVCLLGAGTLQPQDARALPAAVVPAAPPHGPYSYAAPTETSEASAPSAMLQQAAPASNIVERSAFSRTRLNEDGTYTATFSQRPMHWRDPVSEAWREFDNTLRPVQAADAQQGFAYENTANGFRAKFGTPASLAAGRPALRMEAAGAAVSVLPVGAAPEDAQVSGAEITYVDAFPNVDLRYTIDNERAKEDVILKQAVAAPVFTFDLLMEGVSAAQQPDGTIFLVDAAGQTRFVVPRPFMFDSNLQAPL